MTDTVTTTSPETAASRGATSLRAVRRARARRGFAALSVRTVGSVGFNPMHGSHSTYEEIL